MQPLQPEELAKYTQQFQTKRKILFQRQRVVKRIELGLTRLVDRGDVSERATVLEALADNVVLNLQRYIVGADLPFLAWTTRNIFELETILAFVTASRENLKSFVNDLILDEIQVREAVMVLGLDPTDPETTRRRDEDLQRLRNRKAERALVRKRPMSTNDMARAISEERGRDYQSRNKFYSKVVHPTAYLLMGGEPESTNWGAYGLHVIRQGVQKADEFCSRWCNELFGEESEAICD
jgi:hypothetical protein